MNISEGNSIAAPAEVPAGDAIDSQGILASPVESLRPINVLLPPGKRRLWLPAFLEVWIPILLLVAGVCWSFWPAMRRPLFGTPGPPPPALPPPPPVSGQQVLNGLALVGFMIGFVVLVFYLASRQKSRAVPKTKLQPPEKPAQAEAPPATQAPPPEPSPLLRDVLQPGPRLDQLLSGVRGEDHLIERLRKTRFSGGPCASPQALTVCRKILSRSPSHSSPCRWAEQPPGFFSRSVYRLGQAIIGAVWIFRLGQERVDGSCSLCAEAAYFRGWVSFC